MAFILENKTDDGAGTAATVGATGRVTINIFGTFDGAKVDLSVSTYNNGAADVYHNYLQGVVGPRVHNAFLDQNVKVNATVRNAGANTDITVTTGGGNVAT